MIILIWALYSALLLYQFVDAAQTYMLFQYGAYEANPYTAWFISTFGFGFGLLIAKGIPMLMLLIAASYYTGKRGSL
jgi:hypothetical protein